MVKIGIYTITDGDYRERFLVHKTMNKTAEISSGVSIDGSDFVFMFISRYPLDLLERQIVDAEYMDKDGNQNKS